MSRLHLILLLGWVLCFSSSGHDINPGWGRGARSIPGPPLDAGSPGRCVVAQLVRLRGGAMVVPPQREQPRGSGRGQIGGQARPPRTPARGGTGGARYPKSYKDRDDDTGNHITRSPPFNGASTPHYMKAKAHANLSPVGAERQAAFGEVVTVQATMEHTASVIWLHGLGDTGQTWSAVLPPSLPLYLPLFLSLSLTLSPSLPLSLPPFLSDSRTLSLSHTHTPTMQGVESAVSEYPALQEERGEEREAQVRSKGVMLTLW